MGSCNQRIKPSELEAHIADENHKNDRSFFQLPERTEIMLRPKDPCKAIVKVQHEYATLKGLKRMFVDMLESLRNSPASYILIEVQKGRGVFGETICCSETLITASMQLLPTNKSITTFPSRDGLPCWYRLIKVDIGDANFFKITLHSDSFLKKGEELGHVAFELSQFMHQNVVEGWFPLVKDGKQVENALLKLRIQLVLDEMQMLDTLVKRIDERLEELDESSYIRTFQLR